MAVLSIGFAGRTLRLLTLGPSGEVASSMTAALNFDIGEESVFTKDADEYSAGFSELIKNFLRAEDASGLKAGVVIDPSSAFICVLPLDFSEPGTALESHIQWEISNFYPDSSRNFSKRYYRLGEPLFSGDIFESLLIAIDRRRIRFIKSLCLNAGIHLKNIEIGHFASERCLTELYGRSVRGNSVVLSSCSISRVDTSLLRDGKLCYYDFDLTWGENPASVLYRQITAVTQRLGANETLTEIFLYGDASGPVMSQGFSEIFGGTKLTHLDLFPAKIGDRNSKSDSSPFVPLFGLALKNLSS